MCIKSWICVAGLSLLLVAACPSAGLAQNAPTNQPSKNLTLDLGGGVTMELVLIQPGTFMMGLNPNEKPVDQGVVYGPVDGRAPVAPGQVANDAKDEKPAHQVTISTPFYMGKYAVTQKQWGAVMGNNPSLFKGPDNPVDSVTWNDCQAFLRKLGEKVGGGRTFTLPSEAQWEYACRAGSTGKFCYGDDEARLGEYAWFYGNTGNWTHPVGRKKPNAWGLYDMHGNIWQWCSDWYGSYGAAQQTDPVGAASGDTRVVRGGFGALLPVDCRSASRRNYPPGATHDCFGCRVVCGPAAGSGPSK
jgi:formylglycine-generating enzyme required for sulfatase activity